MTNTTGKQLSNLFRKAGIRQTEHGRNSRIGYSTTTRGFEIGALDHDYTPVYGYRNGKKVVVRWRSAIKSDSKYIVQYHSHGTNEFSRSAQATVFAQQEFAKMLDLMTEAGFTYTVNNYGLLEATVETKTN